MSSRVLELFGLHLDRSGSASKRVFATFPYEHANKKLTQFRPLQSNALALSYERRTQRTMETAVLLTDKGLN